MVGFVERSFEVNSCECKSQGVAGDGGGEVGDGHNF